MNRRAKKKTTHLLNSAAFYGALVVINKHRVAEGKEPHPVPDAFKPRPARKRVVG